jgi:4-hydroxythreonine-4-phosphate dehydrogenase
MGEPAGIGGELTLLAWQLLRGSRHVFAVIDDPGRLARMAQHLGWPVPVRPIDDIAQAPQTFAAALPVLPLGSEVWADPGKPREENGAAVIASIERAVALARSGKAAAVVTNPINKAVLTRAGFSYPGHTEFLAALAGVKRSAMMLAADELRVVPVTVHVPVAEVPRLLTRDIIVDTGKMADDCLRRFFGLARPRIAVTGLNPHAGEEGTMGAEETQTICPAIDMLRSSGVAVSGPHAADTMFTEAARATYDTALCMYHDQALIPIKTLAMDRAVNLTLGLSFVRTSPDHGTAFDIAGRGTARPDSLIAAIELAGRIAAVRIAAGRAGAEA